MAVTSEFNSWMQTTPSITIGWAAMTPQKPAPVSGYRHATFSQPTLRELIGERVACRVLLRS